jgi:hypothetical protein
LIHLLFLFQILFEIFAKIALVISYLVVETLGRTIQRARVKDTSHFNMLTNSNITLDILTFLT